MDGSVGYAPRGVKTIRMELERLSVGRMISTVRDERDDAFDRVLRVVVGSERGAVLQGSTHSPMVLVPIRGAVRLADGESTRMLRYGQLAVMEPAPSLQIDGGARALWIALVAAPLVWRQLFDAATETPLPEPLLLPAIHAIDRMVCRAVVRMARDAARSNGSAFERTAALIRFTMRLVDLQSSFDTYVKRCPGRSLSQRRSVFARLQRARIAMEMSHARGHGVAELARIANYSPCHFVRTFSAVFGDTPHTLLNEQRLLRAHRLIHETRLSITEVARASGFEDRCAFARSFKQRFGITATETRRYACAATD
jgi:AraC family transcriptional regulator